MSLATLARKTEAKGNISANGFSSAGTIRGLNPTNKPYMMSTVRTPMKGTTAIGYGGCCGHYVESILSNNRPCCPGTGISSETNAAVLQKKTRHLIWAADRQPFVYADHIRKIRVDNSCVLAYPQKKPKTFAEGCCVPARIGSRLINRSTFYHEEKKAKSSSDYTATDLYRNNCLPTPPCKAPFPTPVNPTECGTYAKTPEEAIRLGLLPRDWGRCKGKIPGRLTPANPYV